EHVRHVRVGDANPAAPVPAVVRKGVVDDQDVLHGMGGHQVVTAVRERKAVVHVVVGQVVVEGDVFEQAARFRREGKAVSSNIVDFVGINLDVEGMSGVGVHVNPHPIQVVNVVVVDRAVQIGRASG